MGGSSPRTPILSQCRPGLYRVQSGSASTERGIAAPSPPIGIASYPAVSLLMTRSYVAPWPTQMESAYHTATSQCADRATSGCGKSLASPCSNDSEVSNTV